MSTLGFDKYVEPLKLYLHKYRESVKGEKGDKRPKRDDELGYDMPYGGAPISVRRHRAPRARRDGSR